MSRKICCEAVEGVVGSCFTIWQKALIEVHIFHKWKATVSTTNHCITYLLINLFMHSLLHAMYCTFDGLHISLRIGNNKRGSIDVSRNLLPQIDDDLRFSLKPTFGCKHTITILAVATSCTMTIARYPFSRPGLPETGEAPFTAERWKRACTQRWFLALACRATIVCAPAMAWRNL